MGNGNGDDLLGGNGGIRKVDNHLTYTNKSTSVNTSAAAATIHQQQFGVGQNARTPMNNTGLGLNNNNNNSVGGGPLLDFKSAFSVLDDKPGSLR